MQIKDLRLKRIEEEAGETTAEAIRILRDAIIQRDEESRLAEALEDLWEEVPFDASMFTASGSMTWGVDAADVSSLTYSLKKNVLKYKGVIINTDVGGVASTRLRLQLPVGLTVFAEPSNAPAMYYRDAGGTRTVGLIVMSAGDNFIGFDKIDGSNWTITSSDNTAIIFNVTLQVR